MRQLATAADTEAFFLELPTGGDAGYKTDPLPAKMTAAVMDVLQLMENVFTEFRFDQPLNMQNPRSGGWITTFRTWVKSPSVFDRTWAKVEDTYQRGFREFVGHLRKDDTAERDVL